MDDKGSGENNTDIPSSIEQEQHSISGSVIVLLMVGGMLLLYEQFLAGSFSTFSIVGIILLSIGAIGYMSERAEKKRRNQS